jgi:hypothetical protein
MNDLIRRIIKAVRNAPDTQHARERVAELLATKDQPVSYHAQPTEHQTFHVWLLGQPAVVNCAYAVDPATLAIRYYNSEDQAAWEGWQERAKLGEPLTAPAIAYIVRNTGEVKYITPDLPIPDDCILLARTGSKIGDAEQLLEDKELLLSIANELQTLIEFRNTNSGDDDWDYESCQNIQEIVDRM